MKSAKMFLWTCYVVSLCSLNVFATSYETMPMVSAHTDGEISRDSNIQVYFTENVAELNQLHQALENPPMTFEPSIQGNTVWKARNILEFRPSGRLPSGQKYTATVNMAHIGKSPAAAEPFIFTFMTRRQAFETRLDGLVAVSPEKPRLLRLTGKVTTADAEDNDNILNMLTATHAGKQLNVTWSHSYNGRKHQFTIGPIVRQDKSSDLVLRWDGHPLGIDRIDEQIITIPPDKPFDVLQVRAIKGGEQYIEIRFSDPLQEDQNLEGLIWVADTRNRDLRTEIHGSIIRLYNRRRWQSKVQVVVRPSIKNSLGGRLGVEKSFTVDFAENLPQVRFIGNDVILPTTAGLTIPIETYNLRKVIVKAIQVYEKNVPQFLQVNGLDGNSELKRVGQTVWQKVVQLDLPPEKKNSWVRYGLDLTPLVKNNPGGLYRLQLSFLPSHIIYNCPPPKIREGKNPADLVEESDDLDVEQSYWDYYEYDYRDYYENRWNPCHPAYYRDYYDHDILVARNVLVSDLGLIAKRGEKEVFVVATDIKTAQPLAGVDISVLDYQQQVHSMAKTGADGIAVLSCERKPFLIVAKHGTQTGFLKLDDGSALSVSHFDVGGQTVKKGLKGFLYGERGIWRPGDTMYLTFLLWDQNHTLPKGHPVIFELRNPKGQLVKTIRKKESLNGFYTFQVATDPEAPTGNWTAKVRVGGVTFEKVLKVETVMPNRLKIALDFGGHKRGLSSGKIEGELSATWLHGAIAKHLNTDVTLAFTQRPTRFTKYGDYIFDDPVRRYKPEGYRIFEGTLDEQGKVIVTANVQTKNVSPGMLTAHFTTRVFEPSGAFSIDRFSLPYHPYNQYVGLRLPKGDAARGMLLTDTTHAARLTLLDKEGNPVPKGQIDVGLYKLRWRWWWDQGANYVESISHEPVTKGVVEIKDGYGEWPFQVKFPSWGRYLVRACDQEGDHCTGKVVYIDWPGWAGRAQRDMPGGGANVLTFSADKKEYTVGEKVVLTIPAGKEGRGLVSIESDKKVLQSAWIEGGEEVVQYEFFATRDMTPNVYAHVTFLQPHLQAANDRPIRMYGVIPIKVKDPGTQLQPQIETPEVFLPEETAQISISEAQGKAMTYTVAVVDEGLLGLTRFQTPDPWNHFYQRVALGVKTWDIFDIVAGAYSGVLEKLLAIGGSDAGKEKGRKKADRFPPMVRFLGPFELAAGATNTHDIDIPQYVGAVKVMVAAAQHDAFGSVERAVFVKKPLMILGTLPRVLGPDEEAEMPISVFAMEDSVKEVLLQVETDGPLSLVGSAEKSITFAEPGDAIVTFRVKTSSQIGIASATIQAFSGDEKTAQRIELDVRTPGAEVVDVVQTYLPTGERWQKNITFPGMAGTNEVSLEISRIPPLNLGKRLKFLIRYPHGCIEQTTSSVFPQVYLDKLLELSPSDQDKIQRNIKAGISRLLSFQTPDGGFAYWPGDNKASYWGSNYAGHFLVEARKAGYVIPGGMLQDWTMYQQEQARNWEAGANRGELIQAYRLYTLALADAPELGAMNRLRETIDLPNTARWMLAAAYLLAGQQEAAEQLADNAGLSVPTYTEFSNTYGSDLRDEAMILEVLSLMNRLTDALPLVKELSEALSGKKWLSTQTTAYALIALARHTGVSGESGTGRLECRFSWNNGEQRVASSEAPIVQLPLDVTTETSGVIELENTGESGIYPRLIIAGTPAPGTETAAENGMTIDVEYVTQDGKLVDLDFLEQGTDIIVKVTVKNTSPSIKYEEVALSQIFPSGWEIQNARLDPSSEQKGADYEYQDIRDDRIYTYFDIAPGQSKVFRTNVNASYRGKFYLPMVTVETMYDATINARVPGRWISIIQPGTN